MFFSNECEYSVSAKQSWYKIKIKIKNIIIRYISGSCNWKFDFSLNCNSHNSSNVVISAQKVNLQGYFTPNELHWVK